MPRMGAPRDPAWAARKIAKHGRPMRHAHVTLAQGLEERDWERWTQAQREEVLLPFVKDGERIHWSNDGEGFIVDEALGGQGPGAVTSAKSLEMLQDDAAVARLFAQARQSGMREGYQDGYAKATIDLAPDYVKLEGEILRAALAEGASTGDRRLALKAMTNWQDRMMGKPVAAVEDVTNKVTPARQLMRSGKSRVLPASSTWTPEGVAEQERLALASGDVETSDDD